MTVGGAVIATIPCAYAEILLGSLPPGVYEVAGATGALVLGGTIAYVVYDSIISDVGANNQDPLGCEWGD